MTDHEPPRDELLQPSLSAGATEADPPYNIFYALLPGLIGGPPAVTIAMVLIARRLNAARSVIVAIIAIGVLALVIAAVVIDREPDLTAGSIFRVAAVITYAAQFPLLVRRFRSWQLRGKDTAPFVGAGFGLAIAGALVCGVLGASVAVGE